MPKERAGTIEHLPGAHSRLDSDGPIHEDRQRMRTGVQQQAVLLMDGATTSATARVAEVVDVAQQRELGRHIEVHRCRT
jgi:hypothetical protein